ncbi:amino acid ABC transporter permease [Paracidovorax cattleyae]|uniref:Amino acid ABC transporter membrane protein 1, PAAT family n=1 Tax=Paracidovorax cattleyae TaxID=80868 RepID=A0A1H0RDD0_9BURK|nr:amino acid ABC transporter permease [Paracidovorax cattleyae]MBF9266244.1 amino acid ABC transporter permease [Paracidovorax cattleyae]SDP27380.1 amino acid ABC transporter membrane protein 1, PAAT family [Paracidovorax cattleyae]
MDYVFQFDQLEPYWGQLLQGLLHTLGFAAAIIGIGVALGLCGALALTYGGRPLRAVTRIYVEFFRNTPALVQLFLIYFGLPHLGLRLEAPVAGVLSLSLYAGAYFVEIFRSGLLSVPRGLAEAGAALGLRTPQVLWHIMLVPALRNVFPAMASQMVLTLIGTSLISQIGVEDIFHAGSFVDSRTFRSFEVYAVICGLYFLAVVALRLLLAAARRRLFGKES